MSEETCLSDRLLGVAVCNTDHPADAVTALMRAAATILQRSFGAEEAVILMSAMVEEAASEWWSIQSAKIVTRH